MNVLNNFTCANWLVFSPLATHTAYNTVTLQLKTHVTGNAHQHTVTSYAIATVGNSIRLLTSNSWITAAIRSKSGTIERMPAKQKDDQKKRDSKHFNILDWMLYSDAVLISVSSLKLWFQRLSLVYYKQLKMLTVVDNKNNDDNHADNATILIASSCSRNERFCFVTKLNSCFQFSFIIIWTKSTVALLLIRKSLHR